MTGINTFAVIGGDLRQAYLAESIAADGYFVYAAESVSYTHLCATGGYLERRHGLQT